MASLKAIKTATKGIFKVGRTYRGAIRWPGLKNPKWEPLGHVYEIAVVKFKAFKRQRDELKRYGIQKWEVFKVKYEASNINDPKTIELDMWSLTKFEEAVKPQFLNDMCPERLLEAQSYWVKTYPQRSLNTLDTWKNRIITVQKWASARKYAPMHDWSIVKNLSKLRRKVGTFLEEQHAKIFDALVKFSMYFTAAIMAAEAGLRREEVFYSKITDINLDTRIGEVIARDGWEPKMEGDDRRRYYVISPVLRTYLKDLLEYRRSFGNTSEYWFCDPKTGFRPHGPTAITRYFGRLGHRLFGKPISFHRFRHTYVTRLVNRGENQMSVRNAARHQNVSTTETYDHTGPKKALQAVAKDVFVYKNVYKEGEGEDFANVNLDE